ncbi:MAG: ATP-binding protein [Candidatus Magasanikbacteria bacterium]|nr:ATP-binding protein [Candidatus Magasanikbacteria bacterium]
MIKETILEQQARKNTLLKETYIPRYQTAQMEKLLDTNLIKVVLGPRRAGKSFFATYTFKPSKAVYINFDDENLLKVENYDEIIKNALEVYGQTKYLLLDEVQNIPKWELLVNRLHQNGYNILVTGSNSKLLSKELATHLTGRHLPLELLPFSFKEFLQYKKFTENIKKIMTVEKKAELLNYLDCFMRNGGFPELIIHELKPETYLTPFIESLLFKDVIKRYKLRKPNHIYNLETYLINNVAKEFTYERLANNLGIPSWATVVKYMAYLEEAYLLVILGRYSNKVAQRLKSPKKVYMVDNGLITATAVQLSKDTGKLMENLVFTELLKKGLRPNIELFYYKTRNDREIDFIIKQGTKIHELIQVCYDASSSEVSKRETKALLEAQEELHAEKLTVLTWDEKKQIDNNGVSINFMPLWEWLTA